MASKLIIIITIFSTSILTQIDCEKYPDKYIPKNLDDALNYLDCKWNDADKEGFKNKLENDAVIELHFGTGRYIRNNWGLWKHDSEIAKYFHDLRIDHPDDMSEIILTSFHRYLNNKDIQLEEQVKHIKTLNAKYKREREEKEREEFNHFIVSDTVEFRYSYDFITKRQEKKWWNEVCVAKGIIISKDSVELRLQVKLIQDCSNKGVIILRLSGKPVNDDSFKKFKKNIIQLMQVGEIKWTDYNLWE